MRSAKKNPKPEPPRHVAAGPKYDEMKRMVAAALPQMTQIPGVDEFWFIQSCDEGHLHVKISSWPVLLSEFTVLKPQDVGAHQARLQEVAALGGVPIALMLGTTFATAGVPPHLLPAKSPRNVRCPACLKELEDAVTLLEDREIHPNPGNLTICGYCQAPLRFAADLSLVEVDLATLSAQEQQGIRRAQALAQQRKRDRGGAEA